MCPIEIFPERKALHFIDDSATAEVGARVENLQKRRSCENHMEFRQVIVDVLQLLAPVRVLVHLVKKQIEPAFLRKLGGQFIDAMRVEPNVVRTGIKYRSVQLVTQFDMLEHQSRLPHPSRSPNAYQGIVPLDLLLQSTHETRACSCILCRKHVHYTIHNPIIFACKSSNFVLFRQQFYE